MNKKLILSVTAVTILVAVTFAGCNEKKTSLPDKEVSIKKDIITVKDAVKNAPAVPFSVLKYTKASIPSNSKIEFNTLWEASPDGKLEASIEGKGEQASEEGYSYIIIKDIKSGELTRLALDKQEKVMLTAKDLEWLNEDHLLVIIGYPFGTISKGGKIYKVNIVSGEALLYTDTINDKEEFTGIHKSAKGFTFEKFVYEDENFTKGHTESGNLDLK